MTRRNRSAVTGHFVSRAEAEANPSTTVSEGVEAKAPHPCGLPDAVSAMIRGELYLPLDTLGRDEAADLFEAKGRDLTIVPRGEPPNVIDQRIGHALLDLAESLREIGS